MSLNQLRLSKMKSIQTGNALEMFALGITLGGAGGGGPGKIIASSQAHNNFMFSSTRFLRQICLVLYSCK